jgi:fused signal recognition particle receptor
MSFTVIQAAEIMLFQKVVEKLKQGLQKTRDSLAQKIKSILTIGRKIDDDLLTELEEAMISADMGVEATTKIVEDLKQAYKRKDIADSTQLYEYLKAKLRADLKESGNDVRMAHKPPTVVLVVGVNGTGKTTSIAKLARLYHAEGKRVLLAASDTFRAAAIEQLSIWGDRVGVEIVKHKSGADPAAVAFDAAEAAVARNADVLIVDTAGRLHTKANLMRELGKIKNVLAKKVPGAPHEILLVLDATTGQNAISQAKLFNEAVGITGLFLAKLDGTAKGGIIVAIKSQLNIPVKFIGIGEGFDDIEHFDADKFVAALFD